MRRRPGIALVNVLIFTFLTTMFLVVGIQFTQGAMRQGRQANSEIQAYNVALAGINHAVYWLQKQTSQPVTIFDPKSQPAPDEEGEVATAEENLGLVHEFLVDGSRNLWGRYEVGRSKMAPLRDDLTSTGPYSPLYASEPEWTAEDVTLERGGDSASQGTIWRVRSKAYLFERPTGSEPFTLTSPAPIKSLILEGEIRRASYKFRKAAIYSFKDGSLAGTHVTLSRKGSGLTVVEASETDAQHLWSHAPDAKIQINTNTIFNGSPAAKKLTGQSNSTLSTFVAPRLANQLKQTFGTTDLTAIKGMADAFYEDPALIPEPQPPTSFIYIKPTSGTVTFKDGASNPTLSGGGVLFVEGHLTIDGNNEDQGWNGLIFVTGNYIQKNSSTVTGAIMCGSSFFAESNSNKHVTITYSSSELDRVNALLSNYRLNRSTLRLYEGSGGSQTY